MRHGIAEDAAGSDHARQLTTEGRSQVERVARGLRSLEVSPDAILVSPIVRAVQTAEIVAAGLDVPQMQIRRTQAMLPECDPGLFFDELERLRVESVFCIGHAPHLDLTLSHACGKKDEPMTSLRTASVACLEAEPEIRLAWLVWLLEAPMLARLRD